MRGERISTVSVEKKIFIHRAFYIRGFQFHFQKKSTQNPLLGVLFPCNFSKNRGFQEQKKYVFRLPIPFCANCRTSSLPTQKKQSRRL
ncbi:MAG: hypothetical protein EAY75_18040 [Bacteroidetes bacterium]|nr:MAG: hypothetical protein EAY75_18040 [Bacteroidota bacterium]